MKHYSRRTVPAVLLLVSVLLLGCAQVSTVTATKIVPAKTEPIAGTNLKRLTLVAEAAKRLDIQTTRVREEPIVRKWKVGGEVVSGTTTTGQSSDIVYVRVRLSEGEMNKVDQSQPALVLRLSGDAGASGLSAQVVKPPALDNPEDTIPALYYFAVGSARFGLTAGQRVFVELPLLGSGVQRKIIPYAAVMYDKHGNTWTYTNPEPLVFIRQPIKVDYIERDQAILLDGPIAGTAVVTVGVAELYGAEVGVGK
jgi:hypothetical protein